MGSLSRLTFLQLSNNNLSGSIPSQLSNLSNLTNLRLSNNALTSPLPRSFTKLKKLNDLQINGNSGLCAPADAAFQAWVGTITTYSGQTCPPIVSWAATTYSSTETDNDATLSLTVNISPALTEASTVTVTAGQSTQTGVNHASSTSDYTVSSMSLVLPANTGSTTFDVTIKGDDSYEPEEVFILTLSPIANAPYLVGTASVTVTIADDDASPDRAMLIALYDSTGGDNWTTKTNWKDESKPISTWHGVTVSQNRVISLGLSSNNLTGMIPLELGNLSNLTGLSLSDNALSGSIPKALGNLSSLNQLILAGNDLSGSIPKELGSLSRLEILDLADNDLTGMIPTALSNLSNLKQLDLSNNALTSPLPLAFTKLTKLTTLRINGNSGLCAPADAAFQTYVAALDTYSGQTCPPIVSWAATTYSSTETDNDATLSLTVNISPTLTEASTVTVTAGQSTQTGVNHASSTSDYAVSGTSLVLPANTGSTTFDVTIKGDDSYEPEEVFTLTLSPIANAPYLVGTASVTVTIADDDASPDRAALIALYDATDGANWTTKTNWKDESKPISTWYGVTVSQNRVTSLNLFGNNLTGTIPTALGNLSSLTRLNLSGNNLSGMIPTALGDLSNLTILDLSDNDLTGMIPTELGDLSNLTQLILSDNDLTGMIPTELGDLSNLTILILSGNALTGMIPTELGDLSGLEVLRLSDNSLTGMIPTALSKLSNLKQLDLSNNSLTSPLPRSFTKLKKLNTLKIEGNSGLCAPADAAFQTYVGTITTYAGQTCPPIVSWAATTSSFTETDNDATLTLTVNISPALTEASTVTVTAGQSTQTGVNHATSTSDYTVSGTSLVLPANTGSTTFDVTIKGDNIDEPDEVFILTLSAINNAPYLVGSASVTVTIVDDDAAPTGIRLSLDPSQVTEDGGSQTVSVTAMLNESALLAATTVTVSVNDGTATSPEDYGSVSDFSVTIAAGQRSGTGAFTMTPVNDSAGEGNETVLVSGSTPGLTGATASLIIRDDDMASRSVALAVSPSSVGEGDGATTVTVTATLNASVRTVATTVTVSIGATNDSATEGTDYGDVSDVTVTIAVGQRSGTGTFTMTPTDDSSFERNETVSVRGSASGLSVVPSTLTIVDDDASPDRAALIALYDATDGANWTTKTNWKDESKPISTWYGVTVSQNRVTRLDLLGNALSGSIPKELGKLSNLTRLNLGFNSRLGTFNQLTGMIPKELGSLSNLTSLDLSNNALSGSIPSQLGNLSNLTSLDLSNNALSGSIPSQLGNLSNLTSLILPGNRLTGMIPTELGSLSNLTSLDLSRNRLTGMIPTELGSLSNLTSLDLSRNRLPGRIPTELGSLSNLTSLILFRNRLSGPLPQSFTKLKKLNTLWIERNFGLCAPTDAEFQTLVEKLDTGFIGPRCLFDVSWAATTYSSTEADNDATLTLTVNISPALTVPSRVSVAAGQSTQTGVNHASSTSDYTVSGTSLELPANKTSTTFDITIKGDDINEPEEVFILTLSPIANAPYTVGSDSVTVTIVDDDAAPTGIELSLDPSQVTEDGGSQTVSVTAMLNESALPSATTVSVSVSDGTATSPEDYGSVSDFTVTIAAGQRSGTGTFTMTPVNDSAEEGNETVLVSGSTPGLTGATASLIIRDDDMVSMSLSVSPSSVGEEDSATTVTVTATLNANARTVATVTVSIGDASDSATEGTDYGDVSDVTVTIAVGQRSGTGTFTMTPTDDSFLEGDETVSVRGSASGLSVVPSTLTIVDDDSSPDRTALIALYDATDGANWTTKTNWKDESKPISTWYGVTVSQNRVTSLNLSNNNLSGMIPGKLGDLSNLTILNLFGNALTGSIPKELGKLSRLTNLGLFRNQLSRSIPSQLGNLSNLEVPASLR